MNEPANTNRAWYALHVKPNKELQVYHYLRTSTPDVDVYYPSISVEPVNPRSRRIRPFFPRYMFVQAALEELGQNALQWLPGAVGLVRFGGEPAIIPDNFIYELKRRVVAAAENEIGGRDNLRQGDRVRLTSGPFADCEGIFATWLSGKERAQIFLEWLGRQVTVTTSSQHIRRAKV